MAASVPGVKIQAKRGHLRIISGLALQTQRDATIGPTPTNKER
jgi:hypothetical protein